MRRACAALLCPAAAAAQQCYSCVLPDTGCTPLPCTMPGTYKTKAACMADCPVKPPPSTPAPPAPPAPPPPASGCAGATSVSLSVQWRPVADADTYDVQYVAHRKTWPKSKPEQYTSQTSALPSAFVADLRPATHYAFRVRSHKAGTSTWGWGGFTVASFTCETAAAPAGAPRAVRRAGELHATALGVAWDPPPGAAPGAAQNVTAHDGGAGHGWGAAPPAAAAPAAATVAPAGATAAVLTGLAPGRVYWVRVGGSDPVPLRTARAGVRYVSMLRVSSGQNEVDFLTDKNTGDVRADAGYLTFASGSAVGGRWIKQFKDVVMSEYCVEAEDAKWAGYMSCDAGQKGGREPSCTCRCVADAQFAHETCTPSPIPSPNPKNGPVCRCSKDELAYSKKYLGRELIKLPFGSLIPGAGNTPLGYWMSTPSGGMCAEGASVGDGGCTWARHPVANVVKGSHLLDQGFTPGKTGDVTKAVAWHNGNVTAAVFKAHPTYRCCGC